MPSYKERFEVGERVRIAGRDQLEEFRRTWRFHHPLSAVQLGHAGCEAEVAKIAFYHGGDVLYWLKEIEGTWHEQCLLAAGSEPRL